MKVWTIKFVGIFTPPVSQHVAFNILLMIDLSQELKKQRKLTVILDALHWSKEWGAKMAEEMTYIYETRSHMASKVDRYLCAIQSPQ